MNDQTPRGERGSVFVQVAISLVAILLVAGLAIDVGSMYRQRRHMQNAADAGALAGARELCIGHTSAQAIAAAQDYAGPRNGAITVTAVVSDNIVIVTTTIPVQTFLVRIVGLFSTNVKAVAKAACGSATKACGIFPLAFDKTNWDKIACGQKFLVFEDDNASVKEGGLCSNCDCSDSPVDISNVYSGKGQLAPGTRGWLRLPDPSTTGPYKYPINCKFQDCNAGIDCFIKYGWTGQLPLGACIAADPGVVASSVDYTIGRQGDTVRILLWSAGCPHGLGCSGGTAYQMTEWGCLTIDYVFVNKGVNTTLTLDPFMVAQPGKPTLTPGYKCPKKMKAILVTKLCDCPMTNCGATSGTPVPDGGVGAVSLVR